MDMNLLLGINPRFIKRRNLITFSLFLIYEILLIYFGITGRTNYLILLVAPIGVFLSVKLRKYVFYMVLFLLITVPKVTGNVPNAPIKFPVLVIFILIIFSLFWEIFVNSDRNIGNLRNRKLLTFDIFYIVWLVALSYSFIFSLALDTTLKKTLYFLTLYLQSLGYIFGRCLLKSGDLKRILPFLAILSGLIVSYYYIPRGNLIPSIARTQTVITALFSATFSIYILAFERPFLAIGGIIGIVTSIFAIMGSLTRTMWAALFIGWLLSFGLLMLADDKRAKKRLLSLGTGGTISVLLGWFFLVQSKKGFFHKFMVKVIPLFLGREPTSVLMRKLDIVAIWKEVLKSPIWGHGVAAMHWAIWKHGPNATLDNGYLDILWHFGIVGFIGLFGLMIYVLLVGVKRFKESKDIVPFFAVVSTVEILIASVAVAPFRYIPMFLYYIWLGMFVQEEEEHDGKR